MILDESKTRKVLVINPFGIGDVLFSTPLLRNLHIWKPDLEIYYLCNKRVAPLLENHPLIKKIFIYERDDFERIAETSRMQWFKAMTRFLNEIRRECIDASFDLSLNVKYGFFCWYGGIKKRIGLNFKKRGRFLTHRVPFQGFLDTHVAEYHLDLLRFCNIPIVSRQFELFISDSDEQWGVALINAQGYTGRLMVSIAPCGGESFGKNAYIKRWPSVYYAELANRLIDQYNAAIFLLAGPKEKEEVLQLIDRIKRKDNVYNATDDSITQIAALVKMSDLVVANDTGPLRFANALNKKIVALFGPVNEVVYGLYPFDSSKHYIMKKDLPCRPCYQNFRLTDCARNGACLKEVTVDEVYDTVCSLL